MSSPGSHVSHLITKNRNLHLTHIEDCVLDFSLAGAKTSVAFLEALVGMLQGHTPLPINVTTKWDGSPAIFVGVHPETHQYFIATKSLFNKTAKVNYSVEDIYTNHGRGELSNKLVIAFNELRKLDITGILQGDLLYTNEDLQHCVIDNQEYLSFTPNTITYAVPINSELAAQIRRSKVGVVFHTSYTGKTLETSSASFGVNLEDLSKVDSVWYHNASLHDESGTITATQQETAAMKAHLVEANQILQTVNQYTLTKLIEHPHLIDLIKIYVNSNIRSGEEVTDSHAFVERLISFIHQRLESEKKTVSTAAAKARRDALVSELHRLIELERQTLCYMFEFQQHIVQVKQIIIRKLQSMTNIGTFLETPQGYEVTCPEGFVVADHLTNTAVKLVDRLEFSRANFQRNDRQTINK